MYINVSPITWTRESHPDRSKRIPYRTKNTRDQGNFLYIDGNHKRKGCLSIERSLFSIPELTIYAHRLFGPLPDIATYLCYWEFDVGRITGEVKPSFLLGTTCFAQTFVYDMIDEDNAVPSEIAPAADPDVTFVKANVKHVDVCLMNAHSAAKFTLDDGLALNFDNLVNQDYTQRVNLSVPSFAITGLANQDQYTTQSSLNQVRARKPSQRNI